MKQRLFLFLLLISMGCLLAFSPLRAFEPPSDSIALQPSFADRLFPYIAYAEVWGTTPAQSKDTAVPNAAIVYGAEADRDIVAEAGTIPNTSASPPILSRAAPPVTAAQPPSGL